MKKLIIVIAFLAMIKSAKAQTAETREVSMFKKVEISGSANVSYTKSDTLSVKVIAADNDKANIITINEGDVLVIKAKGTFLQGNKIIISAPYLQKITINGAAKFSNTNSLKVDTLFIDASGASDVVLNIEAQLTDVIIGGASGLTINGTTKTLNAKVSGAATLKSYKLISAITNVATSGASTAKVFANQKVNASATGSSTIKIKGDPQEVSAEASSSSSITKVTDETSGKNAKNADSTTFNFKSRKFIIIDKEKDDIKISTDDHFRHWSGLGFGVNGYTSKDGFNMPANQKHMELNYGRSFNFQFNPFQKNIHIYKDYVNLVTGLGFEWNHYEFNNSTKLDPDDANYTTGMIDTAGAIFYKKNRLNACYLNVPLLLEFNTNKNPSKSFHVAFGLVTGYILNSKTKQVIKDKADVIRITRKDSYNLNPWRFNAYASIGYHNVTIFASYAVNPLFQTGKGPELNPFTVGVKLFNF